LHFHLFLVTTQPTPGLKLFVDLQLLEIQCFSKDGFAEKHPACPDDNTAAEECLESSQWLARTRTLIIDLFSGKQFSLKNRRPLSDSS
jgi:hypothetical protein